MNNLIRFSPFGQAGKLYSAFDQALHRNLGEFLGGDFSSNTPAVNIRETDKNYVIELGAPGLQKEDFKISIEDKHLVISAEQSASQEQTEDKFLRREFTYSQFSRSFKLPEQVDPAAIQARYEQGILQISLPKKEETQAAVRTISID